MHHELSLAAAASVMSLQPSMVPLKECAERGRTNTMPNIDRDTYLDHSNISKSERADQKQYSPNSACTEGVLAKYNKMSMEIRRRSTAHFVL